MGEQCVDAGQYLKRAGLPTLEELLQRRGQIREVLRSSWKFVVGDADYAGRFLSRFSKKKNSPALSGATCGSSTSRL